MTCLFPPHPVWAVSPCSAGAGAMADFSSRWLSSQNPGIVSTCMAVNAALVAKGQAHLPTQWLGPAQNNRISCQHFKTGKFHIKIWISSFSEKPADLSTLGSAPSSPGCLRLFKGCSLPIGQVSPGLWSFLHRACLCLSLTICKTEPRFRDLVQLISKSMSFFINTQNSNSEIWGSQFHTHFNNKKCVQTHTYTLRKGTNTSLLVEIENHHQHYQYLLQPNLC